MKVTLPDGRHLDVYTKRGLFMVKGEVLAVLKNLEEDVLPVEHGGSSGSGGPSPSAEGAPPVEGAQPSSLPEIEADQRDEEVLVRRS